MRRFIILIIIICAIFGALVVLDYFVNYQIDWFGEKIDNKLNTLILSWQSKNMSQVIVKINNGMVRAEVADTVARETIGLAGRESLGKNDGMIFRFKKSDYYSFWMKGMNFPLDIIWINDNAVVDIIAGAPPVKEGIPKSYFPAESADTVLEVNAGWVRENGVKIGDRVEVKTF